MSSLLHSVVCFRSGTIITKFVARLPLIEVSSLLQPQSNARCQSRVATQESIADHSPTTCQTCDGLHDRSQSFTGFVAEDRLTESSSTSPILELTRFVEDSRTEDAHRPVDRSNTDQDRVQDPRFQSPDQQAKLRIRVNVRNHISSDARPRKRESLRRRESNGSKPSCEAINIKKIPLRRKVDLSNYNVQHREANAPFKVGHTPRIRASTFRANHGFRKMTHDFMQDVYPSFMKQTEIQPVKDDNFITASLTSIFPAGELQRLEAAGYQIGDVLSWSWILTAEIDSAIRRYIVLSRFLKPQNKSIPLFVILQLLRSPHINPSNLELLLTEISDIHMTNQWQGSSAQVLIVRLIRHARAASYGCLSKVVSLTCQLFPANLPAPNPAGMRNLTHFYNRVLSLLALPAPLCPFRVVKLQQSSQLQIIRQMESYQTHISINREGYRALAKVQLMHEKTSAEQEWARAKGVTWPPWRRDQLGIQADLDYPGQKSRVMKVLQRMKEAGYASGDFEMAAQVMAGWDTDMSPTIQTRRLPNRVAVSRAWEPWLLSPTQKLSSRVWAARVEATRSVREAWLCFHSYTEATQAEDHDIKVYHAMFDKLFARKLTGEAETLPLPGDGRETYPDPINPRDIVYVPTDPPNVQELYKSMLKNGIQPSARLLGDLLDNVSSFKQGFQYIDDSTLERSVKDVLLLKKSVPSNSVREVLNALPKHILGSYIFMLARIDRDLPYTTPQVRLIVSQQRWTRSGRPRIELNSLSLAKEIAMLSGTDYIPAWCHLLKGFLKELNKPNHLRRKPWNTLSIWHSTCQCLTLMSKNGLHCNFAVFEQVVKIAQQVATWTNVHRLQLQPSPAAVAQRTFMEAATGIRHEGHEWHSFVEGDVHASTPMLLINDSLEHMIWLLCISQKTDTILELLSWMRRHNSRLQNEHTRIRRHTMNAIRVVLEGLWGDEELWEAQAVHFATDEQLAQAYEDATPFGWATDEEVEAYLTLRRGWIGRVRRKTMQNVMEMDEMNHSPAQLEGPDVELLNPSLETKP